MLGLVFAWGMSTAAAGCLVSEFDGPLSGDEANAGGELPEGYSALVYTSDAPSGHGDQMQQPDVRGDGPCACSTQSCLQEWVDDAFGCNICVAVVCAGSGSHVCTTSCDATAGPTLTDPGHPR